MKAYLIRHQKTSTHTLGVLVVGYTIFYILEPPWRDNVKGVSCIPAGTYQVDYMHRSASGKYRKCYHVTNVPGRTGILIHNGNLVSHTRGCLLAGTRAGTLSGQVAVLSSRAAMRKLREIIGPKSFTLEVI